MRRICVFMFVGLLALLSSFAATAQAATLQHASRWQPGIFYDAGKVVIFESASYKCLYSHTAVTGWEPPKASALWQPVGVIQAASKQGPKKPTPRTKRIFAPYIHMSETNNNLPDIQRASAIKDFTLAFIVADGGCSPAWQGKTLLPLANEKLYSQYIEHVRNSGGDVIISFGGYVGTELTMACPDATALTAAYQSVVDTYKSRSLDFDIEASDAPSIQRRSEALARLVRTNPGLEISFTLPVFATGMPQTALDLLKSAHEYKVPVSVVNLMTMDYGQPVPDGNMGPAAVLAVENALSQLRLLGLKAGIGITPMIGMNDTPGESFSLADADTILSYAHSNNTVRRLSMWSVGRDHGGCVGIVSPTCSGIAQNDWEFTHIFRRF